MRQPSSPDKRRLPLAAIAVVLILLIGGLAAIGLRGTGLLSRVRSLIFGTPAPAIVPNSNGDGQVHVPSVSLNTIPVDASTGADPAAPIFIATDLPNGPLDLKTVSDDSVALWRFDTHERIPATVSIVPGGIQVKPTAPLLPNHNYRFHVLPGLRDITGAQIIQKTYSFFTSALPPAGVGFDRVEQPAAKGEGFTCLNFGPDGKLYAATHEGKLVRFTVADDGTLSNKEVFPTILVHAGGPRLFTGFTFDPASTPDNMIVYATHSDFGFENAADFSGTVSRLSGPKFEKIEDLVIQLPRSARDHTTNQPKFGPDGALYVPQPSNTALGGPDSYWMMREEHGLSATILRLDVKAMAAGQTIDARTIESGGTFDWKSTNTPLTVYATGLRMPYDLLWHSDGNLYTSVNGASSRGATLAGTAHDGAIVPGITRSTVAEHDWFYKIEKGHYYGHPNPIQGHMVFNGGNPTAKPDFEEASDYPVGTKPDPDWTPAIYDYGMHVSADGMVEYRSDRFGGALKGKIFVCRYNIGSDLLCLGLDANGNVSSAVSGIPGTDGLVGPLDVIEDTRNGNLYVAEYHERQPAETRITLLRAVEGGPTTRSTKAVKRSGNSAEAD